MSSRHSIFVGRLSGRMRTHELEDEFRRFGRIKDIDFRKVTKYLLNLYIFYNYTLIIYYKYK